MRKYLLSFCFILLMSSFSLGQISNGDFESWTGGLPDGWTTIDAGITVVEENVIVNGGSASANIDVTTGTQGNTDFRQTISVTAGVEYTFSVFVYHTEGNVRARLYIDDYRGYSDNSVTNSWQEMTYVYTPSSSSVDIGLRFYDQSGFDGAEIVYVDDFTISGGASNDPEPSNHVTSFSAAANGHNQIDLSWTDATGAQLPAGYLIKGSDVSYAAITAPTDGTTEADGGLVLNVPYGDETCSILSLSESTQYFFKIFPYTNAGSNIDYKTDGTVPQDDATTDAAPSLPNAWINEFHYDDAGGDADEFVEIIIEDGSTYTLSDFQVNLYNGNGGGSYNSKTLDSYTVGDIINESGKTFNLYSFNYTTDGGIQNGAPDGLALSYQGTLIQFLSYEGSFSGTDGPANGVASTDIGVSESSANEGSSLGLEGNGTVYGDFTWVAFDASASPGSQNGNQALPVELTSFTASVIKNSVKLAWNTATEINNYGFEILRSVDEENWNNVGFVNGNGTTNSPKDYSFVDDKLSNSGSYYYRLKQIDNDGSYEFSKIIEVVIGTPTAYKLDQNYPNPFNPSTLISFNLPEAGFTNLVVFNSLGQEVATLVNDQLEAGSHQYNFDAKNLTSGIYFYKLESDNFVQVRKMMLLK